MADKSTAETLELKKLRPLIGKKVVDVDYTGDNEGEYTLAFDDGTTAHFSAVGDDHTFATCVTTNS